MATLGVFLSSRDPKEGMGEVGIPRTSGPPRRQGSCSHLRFCPLLRGPRGLREQRAYIAIPPTFGLARRQG